MKTIKPETSKPIREFRTELFFVYERKSERYPLES